MTEKAIQKEDEIKPCPVCMAPNAISSEFCVACGSPFGYESSVFPGMVIRPEGSYWRSWRRRRSRTTRPSFFQLFTSWLIYFPPMIIIGILEADDLTKGLDAVRFIFFWTGVGLEFVCATLLYRITRDYLIIRDPKKVSYK